MRETDLEEGYEGMESLGLSGLSRFRKKKFSRSGNSWEFLENVREFWPFDSCREVL